YLDDTKHQSNHFPSRETGLVMTTTSNLECVKYLLEVAQACTAEEVFTWPDRIPLWLARSAGGDDYRTDAWGILSGLGKVLTTGIISEDSNVIDSTSHESSFRSKWIEHQGKGGLSEPSSELVRVPYALKRCIEVILDKQRLRRKPLQEAIDNTVP
ncbi:hypothetical protein HPB47_025369, partial [Ixodes persulcatus]